MVAHGSYPFKAVITSASRPVADAANACSLAKPSSSHFCHPSTASRFQVDLNPTRRGSGICGKSGVIWFCPLSGSPPSSSSTTRLLAPQQSVSGLAASSGQMTSFACLAYGDHISWNKLGPCRLERMSAEQNLRDAGFVREAQRRYKSQSKHLLKEIPWS
ncbi:hypothetical protein C7476_12245 [Phyllobacterium bourgognense]|uniref:Uncharacterized protein n=1 Tax=Phyllobacterium bourgognense TaxID=314236 RepID=A0A368YER3_9HYPH|nr:hypothetical protein C7476_12245 [Phyllobacterium bourgognense]